MIHDGGADYGHYYSFIYDFEKSMWRRFNDINVSEENEEIVFKESLGGNLS